MRRLACALEPRLDLPRRHRTVARVVIRPRRRNSAENGPSDLHRDVAVFFLDTVGAVVTRATLDRLDLGAGNEREHVACLETQVLHTQVTGDVVAHLAERLVEIRAQQTRAVTPHQVFERIEHRGTHLLHLRVQNLGLKTRDVLALIPGTQVEPIERCSGHDGTYGVKKEYRDISMKIGRPVFSRVTAAAADHYSSDCPMAARQIESGVEAAGGPTHPLKLLRMAYGI